MTGSATCKQSLCLALAGASVAAALTGCQLGGQTKTAASFCKTYDQEKSAFVKRYAPLETPIASDDPHAGAKVLTDLLMGVQSIGDVSVILTKLDKAAPDDIEPDVKAVLDSWKGMQDTMGSEASHMFNPTGMIGDIAKGMLMSAESNGSWTRLGDYITKNCPSTSATS